MQARSALGAYASVVLSNAVLSNSNNETARQASWRGESIKTWRSPFPALRPVPQSSETLVNARPAFAWSGLASRGKPSATGRIQISPVAPAIPFDAYRDRFQRDATMRSIDAEHC